MRVFLLSEMLNGEGKGISERTLNILTKEERDGKR